MKCRVLGAAFWLVCGAAFAQTSDLDALKLADTAVVKVEAPRDWQLFTEAAVGQILATNGLGSMANNRWSTNAQLSTALTDRFRFIMADRLDVTSKNDVTGQSAANTLKEAYVSWQIDSHRFVDIGRINQLYGVAMGYNPTDYFRAGAVRSVVSIDPNSLKDDRLGSVMVRGQTLWDTGSLTVLYSPRIEDRPASAALDPDFGATNNRNRWLLAVTQKVYRNISPQVLLYGEQGSSVQAGVNLNAAPTDAIVTFFEWSGGRGKTQLAEAFNQAGPVDFHQRFATGLTYTTASKVSLTLEYEFDGAAPSHAAWRELRHAPLGFDPLPAGDPIRLTLVEYAARRPDERPAREVFRVARLFADEHDRSISSTFAEDRLRRTSIQIAARAFRRRLAGRAIRVTPRRSSSANARSTGTCRTTRWPRSCAPSPTRSTRTASAAARSGS